MTYVLRHLTETIEDVYVHVPRHLAKAIDDVHTAALGDKSLMT